MKVYLKKEIKSYVEINSSIENVWNKITNVEIEHFKFPWYFRLLNIPKPIKAEITKEGIGGKRIAYFDNKKKFIQEIVTWDKYKTYSFTFNSEDKFKAGYFFNIFQGVFKIVKGTYYLSDSNNKINIVLYTNYELSKNYNWILHFPVYLILVVFQKYLLNTIKVNSELKTIEK